jgi:hypothetical protein
VRPISKPTIVELSSPPLRSTMTWRSYHHGAARGSEQSRAAGHHLAPHRAAGHHVACHRPPPRIAPPLHKRKRRRGECMHKRKRRKREGEESLRDSGLNLTLVGEEKEARRCCCVPSTRARRATASPSELTRHGPALPAARR